MIDFLPTEGRWVPGRQGTGYKKLPLLFGRLRDHHFDLYLVHYPPGSEVPIHLDPVDGKEHHRANLRLFGEDAFEVLEGEFHLLNIPKPYRFGPLTVFRPDLLDHAVRRVSRHRLILSFGWTR